MPILYVNGRRRGTRVSGHAVIRNPAKKRARKRPLAGAALYAHQRKKLVALGAREAQKFSAGRRRRKLRGYATKGRKARRTPSMAKKRRVSAKTRAKLSRKMKARWRARRAGGKAGRIGRTKRRRARKSGTKKRRGRGRKKSGTKKRRGRGRKRSGAKKRGRGRRRSRTVRMSQPVVMLGPSARTVRSNPSRRRRRRRSYRHNPSRRRRYSRRRRSHRRRRRSYRRSYRRNPGNMIFDLAKRALPVLAGVYGSRFVSSKLGSLIPGVSSLGSLTQPVMAVATMIGVNFAAKKVAFLAKHKTELMLGAAFNALDSLFQAFAPASVKSMVGMSDYVQMGDYLAVGGVPPINDSMTLSDYLAVGGDGVSEELGLEEELGVEEELGNDLLGGVSGSALMKRVPSQSFMTPVPARSFTRAVPGAGSQFDNPNQLYTGIFSR